MLTKVLYNSKNRKCLLERNNPDLRYVTIDVHVYLWVLLCKCLCECEISCSSWDLLLLSTSSSSPLPGYKELLKIRLMPDHPPSVVLSPVSFVWFLLWPPVSGHLPVTPLCFRSAFWSKLTEFLLSVTCGVGVLSINSKPFRSQYSPDHCPTLHLLVANSWIVTPISDSAHFLCPDSHLSDSPFAWSLICFITDHISEIVLLELDLPVQRLCWL